jgi:hypothetical protein
MMEVEEIARATLDRDGATVRVQSEFRPEVLRQCTDGTVILRWFGLLNALPEVTALRSEDIPDRPGLRQTLRWVAEPKDVQGVVTTLLEAYPPKEPTK